MCYIALLKCFVLYFYFSFSYFKVKIHIITFIEHIHNLTSIYKRWQNASNSE